MMTNTVAHFISDSGDMVNGRLQIKCLIKIIFVKLLVTRVSVVVDDYLPVDQYNCLVYCKNTKTQNELWCALLEKVILYLEIP